MSGGIVRPARRPAGWRAPGPAPAGPGDNPNLVPGPEEDLCYLSGDWRLFQPRRGHRWSLDDLVTAWVATATAEERAAVGAATGGAEEASPWSQVPERVLDLGCGLGSVLSMVAWRWPHARVLGVEAQPARAALARRSLEYNGAAARCRVLDGDLRDPALAQRLAGEAPFALITATPPYFPRGTGPEPAAAGAAPCRFELRGGVEDYVAAAAPLLASGGRLVMCSAALETARVAAAARAQRLTVTEHWEVIPREGKPALVMVDELRARPASTPTMRTMRTLTVRDRHGAWTAPFRQVRAAMGLPPTSPSGA